MLLLGTLDNYSNQYRRLIAHGQSILITTIDFFLDLDLHTDTVYYVFEVGEAVELGSA